MANGKCGTAARWILLATCHFSLVTFAGCAPGEVLGKVSGRVTFEGRPVSPGIVMFGNREKGVYMTAPLGKDGSYKIVMAKGDGLPLGHYQVGVTPPLPKEIVGPLQRPTRQQPTFENIPMRYRRLETSPLALDVHEGENPFDISMQP